MSKSGKPKPGSKASITHSSTFKISSFVWIFIIPLVTFIVYRSVSTFDMTNWDDKAYLQETPMVRDLNSKNLHSIFTEKVLNSYNPIVLLTFAYDYKMSKLKPQWCHSINLFFHILNALLVFVCMRKLKFKNTFAALIAILFAIHPLATEAVAWIAGRKDVVYLFFFLLSWSFYLDFYHSKKKVFFILSIFFFVISLLSKVQAITLPFVLIASDLMLDKRFDFKRLINKIPFILLSILFGVIAISGSGELVADKYSVPITFIDKVIYSVMAFGLYFFKIIFPVHQIAIYQFPQSSGGEYMSYLILGITAIVVLVGGFIYSLKKNPRLAGGILFFCVAIFPVLHIVAVNSALIYERFVYLADIGILIAVFSLIEKFPKQENRLNYGMIGVCLLFSILSYARIPVWKNSISLWTDIIEKDPTATDAYTNRGQYYDQIGDNDKAFADFSESVRLQPKKPGGYHNRAVTYFKKGNFAEALKDNLRVLQIDSTHTDALYNRGAIYVNMEKVDSAIYYYQKAIKVSPHLSKSYFALAGAYYKLRDFKSAAENFKRATEEVTDYTDAYIYLALSYAYLGMDKEAELSMTKAERLDPNSAGRNMLSIEYVRIGNAAFQSGNKEKAMEIFRHALEIDPRNAEAYYNIGGMFFVNKNVQAARENWKKALEINPNHADSKVWMQRTGGMN